MSCRVAITGIGPVTSAGIGVGEFFGNLCKGLPACCEVPAAFSRAYAFHSKWYVPGPRVLLSEQHLEFAQESLLQPKDRLLLLAAKLAMEDAGYTLRKTPTGYGVNGMEAASVVVGTGMSALQTALESHVSHALPREVLAAAAPERRFAFNRMVVSKSMPNSPAAWVSICFGLRGASSTLNASCASGTYAVGEGFRRVKDGYDTTVLAGGVELLQDPDGFTMRGFDVLGVLTQAADGRPGPFGKERTGFLFAEGGACVLVLEELSHAVKRGAPIHAEILDYQANSDACSIMQIEPEGKQIRALLGRLAKGRSIQYLNAHGTGTLANDETEAGAIRAVFGGHDTQPYINSTKGILGHTLGASGAIEAAVAALSIAHGVVHGNATREPMENLKLPLQTVHAPIEQAISVSYGFGGHNGGLLLARCGAGR
jgi:3-oxoacyl-[acyl-carrier-protein] synthase II